MGVSSTDERLPYPALLITTSSEPKASIARFFFTRHRAAADFVGHIQSEEFHSVTITLRQVTQ